MGPPSYMQSVVDRNVVMRRIPVIILKLSTRMRPVAYHNSRNADLTATHTDTHGLFRSTGVLTLGTWHERVTLLKRLAR
jgi:hypothetical protein